MRNQIKKGLLTMQKVLEGDTPSEKFTKVLPKTIIYRFKIRLACKRHISRGGGVEA